MFKAGDKVRCIAVAGNCYISVGKVYTVVRKSLERVQVTGGLTELDHWYPSELFEFVSATPKYKTKPISYKGCHPVIEEHLRRGEAIFCRTLGTDMEWVFAYTADDEFPYQVLDNSHRFATPVTFKKKLKPLKECLNLLIDNGWELDEWGYWTKPNHSALTPPMLLNWNKDCTYPDFLFEEVWK